MQITTSNGMLAHPENYRLEVKSILDVHNSLRQTIAAGKFVAKDKLMPPAKTSIPDLTWDCGIEQSAQKHASQCQFEHSTGFFHFPLVVASGPLFILSDGVRTPAQRRLQHTPGFVFDLQWGSIYVQLRQQSYREPREQDSFSSHCDCLNNLGENLYMMWSSVKVTIDGQGKAASDSWANEFQEYGWSDIKFTMDVFNSGVGHATQMAWQKTTQIGCGMALCKGEKSVLVTCQYRDAGNYINQYVYIPK
ncbi:hypothetical protein PRIPAC_86462 [Pristionchus pacificus]|nr:hypothetical protein PRIPAC_86462 [Pristionchus pacificus]|eukprot:PDM67280.1 hypothetical protein PRIPAC_48697 [Pristionchus pacificus]